MAQAKIIGYDLSNRRRDRRVIMPPIKIEIDGVEYSTVDWSLGGFLVTPYGGELKPNQTVPVTVITNAGGMTQRHFAIAQVVRLDAEKEQLAARFDRLDPSAADSMERVILERLHRR